MASSFVHGNCRCWEAAVCKCTNRNGNVIWQPIEHPINGRTARGAKAKCGVATAIPGAKPLRRGALYLNVIGRVPGLRAVRAPRSLLAGKTETHRSADRFALAGYLDLATGTRRHARSHDEALSRALLSGETCGPFFRERGECFCQVGRGQACCIVLSHQMKSIGDALAVAGIHHALDAVYYEG